MKRVLFICFALTVFCIPVLFGQSKALTFQEAERQGIPFQHLDSLYKSAIHDDKSLAVFTSPEEQEQLLQAYTTLLQDLGKFLKANNFKWESQIRGANRIYFKADGSIDYFLYHFPDGQVNGEKEKEFARLLRLFIQDYRFTITAKEKFAQCSAVKYSDI